MPPPCLRPSRAGVVAIDPRSSSPTMPGACPTEVCGAVQRLEGGDSLRVESDAGRAFEVMPPGEVLWDPVWAARPSMEPTRVARLSNGDRLDPGVPRPAWLGDRSRQAGATGPSPALLGAAAPHLPPLLLRDLTMRPKLPDHHAARLADDQVGGSMHYTNIIEHMPSLRPRQEHPPFVALPGRDRVAEAGP